MARRRNGRERTLALQGAYYLATGVAPFASRRAFEAITGPKAEWWLVQTVGATVAAVGAGLLSAGLRSTATGEIVAIAAGCAGGLAAIDVVHAHRGDIAASYYADAAVQLVLLAGLARGGR